MTSASQTDAGRAKTLVSLAILTLFTVLTFFNSAHDALIFDDQIFVGPDSTQRLERLSDAFGEDLWGHGGGLYRPLLKMDFELQNRLFGDWKPGYHILNIVLHLITTLALFGFIRSLLSATGRDGENAEFFALLATLVFAVHPVHTEVVNSVFNKSSMYVSLASIAGLWWLLAHLHKSPVRAWTGFGLIYSGAILFKEEALVLPGIAVALIVMFTDGGLKQRIRRFLPVFWMLIPIGVYFWLRSAAIAAAGDGGALDAVGADAAREITVARTAEWLAPIDVDLGPMLGNIEIAQSQYLLKGLSLFGEGLKVLAWPHPLRLTYWTSSEPVMYLYIGLQLLLVAWALFLLSKGRALLAFSLVFYYLTLLPSIRLFSLDGNMPHLQERYLYLPSVGMTIALAAAFGPVITRIGRKYLMLIMLPLLLLLAALSWDRNSEWKSAVGLFEIDYQAGLRDFVTIRLLVAAHYGQGREDRVMEICDENKNRFVEEYRFVHACVVTYLNSKRTDDALAALEVHALEGESWLEARLSMAKLYEGLRQKQKVVEQYSVIIERIDNPAVEDFYKAEMLVAVFPNDREQLNLARALFVQAMTRDANLAEAEDRIEKIDRRLAKLNDEDSAAAEPSTEETGGNGED